MHNYLLTIDLNTTRLNTQSYSHLIENIPIDNLEIHIYNYIEQKHNKLPFVNNEIIHNYNGSRKKVALDIPQALDTIELCAKNNYLQVYILCGEFESEFLFNKLNDMQVNYSKIMPTSLRQAETISTIHNIDFSVKQNQAYYSNISQNNTVTQTDIMADSDLLETSESLLATEETGDNINSVHNITDITSRLSEIKNSDITTYTPGQKITTTKLTPEQIKKIYTYIKLKQLRREIN